jgi:hypothetical protein
MGTRCHTLEPLMLRRVVTRVAGWIKITIR